MRGAFFRANDYNTSPGKLKRSTLFGIGGGLLTSFSSFFGSLPG